MAVGFIAPLLRSVLFGMPVMFPMAVCMALEFAAYAAVAGALYHLLPQKRRRVELFTRYTDCVREYQTMAECMLFQNSFRLGARTMMDVMKKWFN